MAGCRVTDNEAWRDVQGFGMSVAARSDDYEKGGRSHEDLLDRSDLEEARYSDEVMSPEALGFCLLSAIQEALLADTRFAWELGPEGSWARVTPARGERPVSAQEVLMGQALKRAKKSR